MATRRMIPHVTRAGQFGIQFGAPGVESWDSTRNWLLGVDQDEGTITQDNVYERSSPIATAIEIISSDASSIPWELYPVGTGPKSAKPVENPISEVWTKPNEYMLGSQLWIGTYVSKLLFGEAWWYYPDLILPDAVTLQNKLARKLGREGTLILLDPRRVLIKTDSPVPQYYLHTPKGDEPLDQERLTVFKTHNPSNLLRGLSPVKQVLIEALGDRAAAAWNARFFNEQNGIPSGMLKPQSGQTLTPEQRGEVLRLWNQRHGSKRSVGILPGGWDWVDLGVNRRDMDFPSLRSYARELMYSRLGVPPFLAGVLEKADYANSKKQESLYWRSTITRFLNAIKETLNNDFLPKMGVALEAWPKMEVVRGLIEDMEALTIIADRLWRMGIPFEQINDRLDLGFDPSKIPGSDMGWMPFGLVPTEDAISLAETDVENAKNPPPPPPAPADNPPPEGDQPPKKLLLPTVNDDRETRRRRTLWRQVQVLKLDLDIRMNKAVRKWMNDLRGEAIRNLEGTKGWLVRNGYEPVKKADELYLIDVAAAKARISRVSAPIYRQAVQRGGESIMGELGLTVNFDMNAPEVIALIDGLGKRIVGITDTIADDLTSSLREGLAAKESLAQLRDRVQTVFGKSLGRSLTIARTEVGKAFTAARFTSMKDHGIRQHMWLSARDEDVRAHHKPKSQGGVDGEIVAIGAPFSNGLKFPMDPDGPAEEVINCRCIAIAVVGSAA